MDIAVALGIAKSLDANCFTALAGLWRELYLNMVSDRVAKYVDEENSFGFVCLYRF